MPSRRAVASIGLVAVLAPWVGSCSSGLTDRPASTRAVSDPAPPMVEPDEPLTDASLALVTKKSSRVVSGSVTGVRSGEHLGEDRTLEYSIITVRVDSSLRGDHSPSQVEIAMSSADEGTPFAVLGRPVPDTGQRAVWFLKTVDPAFGFDGYVLTWSGGQVRVDGNGNVIDDDGETTAAREAVTLKTLSAVKAVVTRAG